MNAQLLDTLAVRFTHAVVHLLWSGTLLAGLVMLTDRVLVRSAAGRHQLHLGGMLLLLLAFPLCLALSGPDRISGTAAVQTNTRTVRSPVMTRIHDVATMIPEAGPRTAPVADDISAASAPPLTDTSAADSRWSAAAPWVFGVYLIGLLLMSCRLVLGLTATTRLRKDGTPLRSQTWLAALRRMSAAVRVSSLPLMTWSHEVLAPVVIGFTKPMIVLPAALVTRLTPGQVEAVLAHELAHLHRRDTWAVAVQRIVETALFFHPAAWWMSRQLEVSREQACDDLVVAAGCDPADYAETLVLCSEARLEEATVSAGTAMQLAAIGKDRSSLRQRVLRILGQPATAQVRNGGAGWWFGVLAGIGLLLAASSGTAGKSDLANFDFENPPPGYEPGVRAADKNQTIHIDGVKLRFSDLTWRDDGFLHANLGRAGDFEIVEFRLFDHATRKQLHSSHWQNEKPKRSKFNIERWGPSNVVRMKPLKGDFPDQVDVWMRLALSSAGPTIILPAANGATVRAGRSELVVRSLLEGSMSGRSAPSSAMTWDPTRVSNRDWQTTINLENRDGILNGRHHLVTVTKDGSRHPMDRAHFLDFSSQGRHAHAVLDVARAEIDHLELVPFGKRSKFFFNAVRIPERPKHLSRPREFIRVVDAGEQVSVQGQRISWTELEGELRKVEDRANTVLEYARAPEIADDRFLDAFKLSIRLGFEYFSNTGEQSPDTVGSSSETLAVDVRQEQRLAKLISDIRQQKDRKRLRVDSDLDGTIRIDGQVLADSTYLQVLRAFPNPESAVLEFGLEAKAGSPSELILAAIAEELGFREHRIRVRGELQSPASKIFDGLAGITIESLRTQDIALFSDKAVFSFQEAREMERRLRKSLPADKIPPPFTNGVERWEREDLWGAWVDVLRQGKRAGINWAEVKFERADGDVVKLGNITAASAIRVFFSANHRTYQLVMDNLFLTDRGWLAADQLVWKGEVE